MRKSEVEIGATYTAKISENLTEVRIHSICAYGGWYATNLRTGRSVRIKSAAKLRERIHKRLTCPNCGKEVWDGPHGYKLAKCWGCGTAFDTMGDEDGE